MKETVSNWLTALVMLVPAVILAGTLLGLWWHYVMAGWLLR